MARERAEEEERAAIERWRSADWAGSTLATAGLAGEAAWTNIPPISPGASGRVKLSGRELDVNS